MSVQRRSLSAGSGAWDVWYGGFQVWRAAARMRCLKGEKWNHTSMSGREAWSAATGISRSELLRRARMRLEAPHESEAEAGDHLEGVRIRGRRSDMVRAKEGWIIFGDVLF